MPEVATSASRRAFATALFTGLLWGIAVATSVAGAAMAFATAGSGDPTSALRLTFEAIVWTAMVASLLAVFPIGPAAGVIGWQLYRRGVVARWAYAAAGALSALLAPLLILFVAVEAARYPTTNAAVINDGVALLLVASFPIVGAFAGFMAGRVIRRSAGA
jgi:hypothetical protein